MIVGLITLERVAILAPLGVKPKPLRAPDMKPWFLLGHDVFMDKVETLCSRALIGRLKYCSMSKEGWVEWATSH